MTDRRRRRQALANPRVSARNQLDLLIRLMLVDRPSHGHLGTSTHVCGQTLRKSIAVLSNQYTRKHHSLTFSPRNSFKMRYSSATLGDRSNQAKIVMTHSHYSIPIQTHHPLQPITAIPNRSKHWQGQVLPLWTRLHPASPCDSDTMKMIWHPHME